MPPARDYLLFNLDIYRKIFEIKEDICYLMVSVAGQRGRLLFWVDAGSTTVCETGAP